jgi:hypothetical protein
MDKLWILSTTLANEPIIKSIYYSDMQKPEMASPGICFETCPEGILWSGKKRIEKGMSCLGDLTAALPEICIRALRGRWGGNQYLLTVA